MITLLFGFILVSIAIMSFGLVIFIVVKAIDEVTDNYAWKAKRRREEKRNRRYW